MSDRLKARVEAMKADYQAVTGRTYEHFFCPFLHVDEPAPLCEGHIINEALGVSNAWVPQRQDFDRFFGSMVEADFVSAVKDRSKSALEKWIDPNLSRRYRPQLLSQGVPLAHYITKEPSAAKGHTSLAVFNASGDVAGCVVIKKPPHEVKALHATDLQVVAVPPVTLVPAIVASVLKAAHLAMFNLTGYRYVFNAAGLILAGILRDFYVEFKDSKKRELGDEMAGAFRPHASMISPMLLRNSSVLAGTAIDNRLLAAVGGTEGIYAIGVIIPAGSDDGFCVWLPSGIGKTIDTYLSFLREPPPSIAVRTLQFCRSDDERGEHWLTPNGDPIRLDLATSLRRCQ